MPTRPRTAAPRPARRRTTVRAPDALAMLREDHRKVAAMFARFDTLASDGVRKASLVASLCRALTVHAKVEEEIVYPAARTVLKDVALVDEADVEHAAARMLIADLERMKPGDDHYDAKVTVLGEYINHHVKEEESEMFPKARKSADIAALGKKMAARKAQLLEEMAREGDGAMQAPTRGKGARKGAARAH